MKWHAIAIVCFSSLLLFLSFNLSHAAQRIFYEDCENTTFSDYFLEDHYGTDYESYWNELTSELTRSSISHSGQYSMTYDPFTTGNPHSVIGGGNLKYGNLSNLHFSDYSGRYWYFRWYQRWEKNIDWGGYLVKLIYINYRNDGDFCFIVDKTGNGSAYAVMHPGDNYVNPSFSGYFSTAETDDEEWHEMEVFIDVGTAGNSNGSFWYKIDGVTEKSASSLEINSSVRSNPINYITGWPSNISGTGGSGTGRTWLDDLEVYTLDSSDDIPPEIGGGPIDNSPVITIMNPTAPTYSTTSSTIDIFGASSDDNGVTSISWSNNRGGSGTVSANLASWSVSGITLLEGDNIITITAQDTAGQTSNDVVTVTCSLTPAPGAPQDFIKGN